MVAANDHKAQAYMGTLVGLKAFTAAVLGGIGNLGGAVAGGFAGRDRKRRRRLSRAADQQCARQPVSRTFCLLVLILVLVFRPSGLLGEKMAERLMNDKIKNLAAILLIGVVLAVLPFVVGSQFGNAWVRTLDFRAAGVMLALG